MTQYGRSDAVPVPVGALNFPAASTSCLPEASRHLRSVYPKTILPGEYHVTAEGSGRHDATWGEKELKKEQDSKHTDEEIILEVGYPAPAAATWSRNKPPSRALPKSLTWTKIRHETKRLFQATRFSDGLLYSNRKLVHFFF